MTNVCDTCIYCHISEQTGVREYVCSRFSIRNMYQLYCDGYEEKGGN